MTRVLPDHERFRNAAGCGWSTGTVFTGPKVCGKPAKATATPPPNDYHTYTANGLVCGIHARVAERRWRYTVTPIEK